MATKTRKQAARTRRAPIVKITYTKPPAVTVLEVFQDKQALWRFRAKAKNHEIIAQGEGYTRKWSAARGGLRAFPNSELRFLTKAA